MVSKFKVAAIGYPNGKVADVPYATLSFKKSIGNSPKSNIDVGTIAILADGYVIDLFSSDKFETQSVLAETVKNR